MCCRCSLVKFLDEIMAWFDMLDIEYDQNQVPDLFENFNASPTQQLPVITHGGPAATLQQMTWGLIPAWMQQPLPQAGSLFNARIESLNQKKSFKNLTKKKRGILVCDGYFEWQTDGKHKIPFYIHKPNRDIMPLACLWDEHSDQQGQAAKTFTVITCPPRDDIATIHDRMPLILDRNFIPAWLNPESGVATVSLETVQPYTDELEAYTVSDYVNSTRHNSPKCLEKKAYYYTADLF